MEWRVRKLVKVEQRHVLDCRHLLRSLQREKAPAEDGHPMKSCQVSTLIGDVGEEVHMRQPNRRESRLEAKELVY